MHWLGPHVVVFHKPSHLGFVYTYRQRPRFCNRHVWSFWKTLWQTEFVCNSFYPSSCPSPLPIKLSVTSDTKVNFDGDFDGHGDGDTTCKQTFTVRYVNKAADRKRKVTANKVLNSKGNVNIDKVHWSSQRSLKIYYKLSRVMCFLLAPSRGIMPIKTSYQKVLVKYGPGKL